MGKSFAETRRVATGTAAFIAFLIFLLLVLGRIVFSLSNFWVLFGIGILTFGISYLLINYAINHFIYRKIKLVYKTIHTQRTPKGSFKSRAMNSESIESVGQAVKEWSSKQQHEIDELKKMADYRREFLGNISHELKTPIFNIQGYVLTLLDGGLEDQNINKDYLMRTEKSINRLIAIVDDLEEISKLESGELKLNLQRFDMCDLVKDVIEFLEMKATKNNTQVVFENKTDRPVFVSADKKRIRQVLINLIENAIKYGDKPENKVNIKVFDMDELYLFEVKDNGPGIAEENLTRIFERFYRTDKGRSRDTGGTGLGLAIVKHIIEAHQQKITARSKLGAGTTFSFTLQKG
ncbi:MAG: ATP-binding protein [Bacteroidales bacterium]|nr:ATP-binding protein [Bacteroidales bacterium]